MVVDDALRVARRSRGVIERDRLPFVGRMLPVELRIAAGDKLFVILRTQPLASRAGGIGDVDHLDLAVELLERGLDRGRELSVGNEQLGFAVIQHERNRFCVETRVQGVEHAAAHRHAKMGFQHLRRVRRHQRNRVAVCDAGAFERGSESARARVRLGPGVPAVGVNDRKLVRIDERGARDQRQRREWRVIGFVPIEVAFVGAGHDAAQETPAVAGGGLSW